MNFAILLALALAMASAEEKHSQKLVDKFLLKNIPNINRQKRYVNGQQYLTAEERSPFLVRIVRTNPLTKVNKTLCSGSIVRDDLVLTAGGCLFEDFSNLYKEKRMIPLWEIEVIAGDFDMFEKDTAEQKRDPLQFYVHPEIRQPDHRKMWHNDIAIIQTKEPFNLTKPNVDKVELWLSNFGVNASYVEYYTMVKASGYGNKGSPEPVQYDNLFDTHYDHAQTRPQYQFYAYIPKTGGSCMIPGTEAINNIDKGQIIFGPETDRLRYYGVAPVQRFNPHYLVNAKRCFYKGSVLVSSYQPTPGDWGGPITWRSFDNNKEYQVFLTPWQLPNKASFEHDTNYMNWGEVLTYYKDYLSYAFEESKVLKKDYYAPQLSASAVTQTHTITTDLRYISSFQFHVNITAPANKYVKVVISLSGDGNAIHTMRTTSVNIRNSNNMEILRSITGAADSIKTDSLDVIDSVEAVKGSQWGCDRKVAVTTESPVDPTTAAYGAVEITCPPGYWSTSPAHCALWKQYYAKRKKRQVEDPEVDLAAYESFTKRKKRQEEDPEVDLAADESFTCNDADFTGDPGQLHEKATVDIRAHWDPTTFVSSTNNGAHNSITVEVLVNKPMPWDVIYNKGSIVTTIEYMFVDEAGVSDVCDIGYRQCDDKFSCIKDDNLCDQDKDCLDGHDETNWCLERDCLTSEYTCSSGECIRLDTLCDGKCDCRDTNVCEDESRKVCNKF